MIIIGLEEVDNDNHEQKNWIDARKFMDRKVYTSTELSITNLNNPVEVVVNGYKQLVRSENDIQITITLKEVPGKKLKLQDIFIDEL